VVKPIESASAGVAANVATTLRRKLKKRESAQNRAVKQRRKPKTNASLHQPPVRLKTRATLRPQAAAAVTAVAVGANGARKAARKRLTPVALS